MDKTNYYLWLVETDNTLGGHFRSYRGGEKKKHSIEDNTDGCFMVSTPPSLI